VTNAGRWLFLVIGVTGRRDGGCGWSDGGSDIHFHLDRCLETALRVIPSTPMYRPNQYERQAKSRANDQNGEGQLDPDPEIAECRFDLVSPRVGKSVTAFFNEGIKASLPPSEVFWLVHPKVAIGSKHQQRGPEPKEMNTYPIPQDSKRLFHEEFHSMQRAGGLKNQKLLARHTGGPEPAA
jgi:hypothetical protein